MSYSTYIQGISKLKWPAMVSEPITMPGKISIFNLRWKGNAAGSLLFYPTVDDVIWGYLREIPLIGVGFLQIKNNLLLGPMSLSYDGHTTSQVNKLKFC